MTEIKTFIALEALRKKLQNYRNSFKSSLTLCGGTGCQASHARDLINSVKNELNCQKNSFKE